MQNDEKTPDNGENTPAVDGVSSNLPAVGGVSSDTPVHQPPMRNDGPFKPHGFHPRTLLINDEAVPTVYITPLAYRKMLVYVEIARKEVGWLGTVRRLPDGDFLIEDTYLLHQEVTGAETELSVEGQDRLSLELIEEGDAGIDKIDRMRFWGHSHVYMGTSPSYTDDKTMLRFRANGLDWYVRGIFNKYGRAEFSVYLYDLSYAFIDAPWGVMEPETGEILSLPTLTERQFFFPGLGASVRDSGVRDSGVRESGFKETGFKDSGVKDSSVKDSTVKESGFKETCLRDSSNKASVFGGTSSPKPRTIPPQLIPDQALREEIQAEFDEKVVERVFFSFFGSNSGNGQDQRNQYYDSQSGGYVAGQAGVGQDGAGQGGLDYYGHPTGEGYYQDPAQKEPGWLGKAFAWLGGLFFSDSGSTGSKPKSPGAKKPTVKKSQRRAYLESLERKSDADKNRSDTQ